MLTAETLEGVLEYLTDNQIVGLNTYEGEPISIELPTTVDLNVVWAEAAVAGDTANTPNKQIELETGPEDPGADVRERGRCHSRRYTYCQLCHPCDSSKQAADEIEGQKPEEDAFPDSPKLDLLCRFEYTVSGGNAVVAQLVERCTRNAQVIGSTPINGFSKPLVFI